MLQFLLQPEGAELTLAVCLRLCTGGPEEYVLSYEPVVQQESKCFLFLTALWTQLVESHWLTSNSSRLSQLHASRHRARPHEGSHQ